MAKVIPVGQPVNDAERAAIAHLRDRLPENYTILHNFEIHRDREFFEVDLALLGPREVVLVDVKGTRGGIHVYGSKWYPEGRTPFTSPLLKLRAHARALKGLITESDRQRAELRGIFVDAAVLLTAPDAVLDDADGRDAPAVTSLKKCAAFFQDDRRRPDHFDTPLSPHLPRVLNAIQGRARPKTEPKRFGHWVVTERLGSTHFFTEYRAVNAALGEAGGTVLLKVYAADPYQPEDRRRMQMARITNAYTTLARVPVHPGVVDERDFFATDDEAHFVLVTEDPHGHALRMHLHRKDMALPFERKVAVARDLLEALAHVHAHGVIHRNLHPGAVMVGAEGRTLITQFEFARPAAHRDLTIAREIVDDLEKNHQAPECFREPESATAASDIFSLGLVLYELFAGAHPFDGPTQVFDREGRFPHKASAVEKRLPAGADAWLQGLCAFEPARRPAAVAAREAFRGIFGV